MLPNKVLNHSAQLTKTFDRLRTLVFGDVLFGDRHVGGEPGAHERSTVSYLCRSMRRTQFRLVDDVGPKFSTLLCLMNQISGKLKKTSVGVFINYVTQRWGLPWWCSEHGLTHDIVLLDILTSNKLFPECQSSPSPYRTVSSPPRL